MSTQEQAIRAEAERSLYSHVDDSIFFLSAFGSEKSWPLRREEAIDRAVGLLERYIALAEAAERVRAATADVSGLTPGLTTIIQSVDGLMGAIEDGDNDRIADAEKRLREGAETLSFGCRYCYEESERYRRNAEQWEAKARAETTKIDNLKEQHEVDKQVIEELETTIKGLRHTVEVASEEIERLTKEAKAVKPQAAESLAEKSDPCRPVTKEEWWREQANFRSYPEAINWFVRFRVAEALADMVPRAEYERAVRQLASGWTWTIRGLTAKEINEHNRGLCRRYGVEPEGGEK